MDKSILYRYRVDNIPHALNPIFYLFGYGMGVILFIVILILRITIKLKIKGREHLRKNFPAGI